MERAKCSARAKLAADWLFVFLFVWYIIKDLLTDVNVYCGLRVLQFGILLLTSGHGARQRLGARRASC